MICFHNYKKIIEKIVDLECSNIFKIDKWIEQGLLRIFYCKKCNKLKGYYIKDDEKHKLNEVELYQFKLIYKIEELNK
jgi:hypothetical protein